MWSAGVQESPRDQSNADTQSNSASRKEQWAEDSDEDAPDPRMWFEGTSKGLMYALPPMPALPICPQPALPWWCLAHFAQSHETVIASNTWVYCLRLPHTSQV